MKGTGITKQLASDCTMLDVEVTFCYLGDILCSDGSCDNATAARCCMLWGEFRKRLPELTNIYYPYDMR